MVQALELARLTFACARGQASSVHNHHANACIGRPIWSIVPETDRCNIRDGTVRYEKKINIVGGIRHDNLHFISLAQYAIHSTEHGVHSADLPLLGGKV